MKNHSMISFLIAIVGVILFGAMVTPSPVLAGEQLSDNELAKANNPLADMKAFNLQNYYVPTLYGLPDVTSNTFWLRAAGPIKGWLVRGSLPFNTVPSGVTESKAGVGDFNIFGAYLAVNEPTLTLGVGPLIVAPTASDDALGAGKWQLGAAAVGFKSLSPVVQLGGLLTWQASVAGDDDRADTSLFVAQPFGFWQLGGGTYLRTSPIWVFDLKSGDYAIPFAIGIGKVLKTSGVVYNMFIEPQYTILHDGVGQPALQVFAGVNMQFTSKK